MINSNQKTIVDYFEKLYKDYLINPSILTSIVPAKSKNQDIISVLCSINPIQNRKKSNKVPIISLNYINQICLENINEELEEDYINSINEIYHKILEKSSIYSTLTVDYHLLNDDLIKILKKKYQESPYTLRIIGDNYTLTKELHKKVSFFKEVYVDNIYEEYEDIDECEVLLSNKIVKEIEIPDDKYNKITQFYIDRILTESEYIEAINYINNKECEIKKLFVKVYNPEEYDNMLDYLTSNELDNKIEVYFIGNPIIDTSMNYEYLNGSNYKLNIIYSTNQAKLDDTTYTNSNNVEYLEELEIDGAIPIKEYNTLLSIVEEIEEKTDKYNFSPFEKMVYVYCYIEKNYYSLRKMKLLKESGNKVGYAKIYSIILRRLNIPTFVYTTSNKMKNIHHIEDKKYKLNQIILSDITSDVESNRYDMYNMFSFSHFGLSPISSVKSQIKEFITVPATLILSKYDYNDYYDKSYNELIKFYNPTKTQRDIACELLVKLGYLYDFSDDSGDDFYDVISNLISLDTFEQIAENALITALKEVISKEYPSYSDERVELEIRNAIISYRLSESDYDYEPQIEILDDEYRVINVKTIKSQRDNEEYNREEMRFANASDKLISKIYEIKEEGIITFTNNDHIIKTLQKALDDLYKNKKTCPLVTMDRRKQLLSSSINTHKENLFSRINEELYYYLKNNIIDAISILYRSKEMKYLKMATIDEYNTEKYNKNYSIVIKKLKLILDSLASQKAKELGITYSYEDHALNIFVENQLIKDYKLQIVSSDIIAASKLKEIGSIVINRRNTLPDTKINDFLELYIETINKYNKKVDEFNQIIYAQELLIINDIKNTTKIINYIELENQATKIEEEISDYKVKLSNIRAEFYERYHTNINEYNSVQVLSLENYSFTESYQEFLTRYEKMLDDTEEEIINYAKEHYDNNRDIIQTLLNFVDSQLSCINRRVIEEGLKKNKNVNNTLNKFYDKKKEICDKLEEQRKIFTGENIVIIPGTLNILEMLNTIQAKKNILLNDKKPVVAQIIKRGTKLKLSTQRLNKFKKSKDKIPKLSKKNKEEK